MKSLSDGGLLDTTALRVKESSNWQTRGDIKDKSGLGLVWAFALLGLCYGGLHATSWNSHFPTGTEQTMWRGASCLVAGAGFIYVIIIPMVMAIMEDGFDPISTMCVAAVAIAAVALPRMFLQFEAFISVRSLPLGAYNTTSWINLLPHIG